MVNGKSSSDGHASLTIVHKVPLPTDNSTNVAQSAKPTSSTSEATITTTKKYKIRRCTESDEEDIEHLINKRTESKTSVTKSVKPKTNNIKQQVIQIRDESDNEDDEAASDSDDHEDDHEDSDDKHTNSKKPVKASSSATKEQVPSKKSAKKRALDSDDDDIVDLTNKSKKSKSKATSSSSSKKQIDQGSDSEDDIIELTKKPTTSKPKTTQKQPIKPGNSTPTKKKQTFMTSRAPEPESSEEEEEEEEEDSSSDEESPNITLTERIGDLFGAPSNTLLVHACNCVGSWNAGIALAFQKKYPAHYAIYQAHCKSRTPNSLLSTCLLIPPQPGSGPNHWIGCLFTSRKYGRGKDSKDDILDSTDSALQDILEQLEDLKKKPKGVWMCKINSGSFKVPWSQTKKLIEALTFKGGLQIDVVDKK